MREHGCMACLMKEAQHVQRLNKKFKEHVVNLRYTSLKSD